jgi:hypothetical protein
MVEEMPEEMGEEGEGFSKSKVKSKKRPPEKVASFYMGRIWLAVIHKVCLLLIEFQ